MAAIDKLYGTPNQIVEFYDWCKENNPFTTKYFYDWNMAESGDLLDSEKYPICNFPTSVDRWMVKHCPIQWVVTQIKHQYGDVENFQGNDQGTITWTNMTKIGMVTVWILQRCEVTKKGTIK